jgi:RND family efflux transporter MFP subunit
MLLNIMTQQKKYLVWALASLLFVSLAFGRVVGRQDRAKEERTLVAVERGTLEIKVVSMGTLTALRSVTVASEIQSNRAKVVRLMPEGSLVNQGDLLVEFDPTPFLEDVTKHSRAVKEAEASLLQAQQEVQLQKAKNAQLVRDAEQRVRAAELELRTLQQGKGPLGQKEARARTEQSEQQLLHASQDFADAEAFLAEGFITRHEYEQARIRLQDAQRSYDLAMASYETLVWHGQPVELERARLNLVRAQDELDRLQKTMTYETLRQQALLIKAETAVEAAQADLQKARAELEKTQIFSQGVGFLVYNEIAFGSEYRKIQIGDSAWQGQAIMTIPDTSLMAVETSIREFDVHKVHAGQKATVTLEAFPDLALAGRVDFIGNLATKTGANRGGKFFSLRVTLEDAHPNLRPGMTAQVEIEVESTPDVLLLPIEAVFRKQDHHYCYLADRRGLTIREVEVGNSNSDYVVIRTGLKEGDFVSLTP